MDELTVQWKDGMKAAFESNGKSCRVEGVYLLCRSWLYWHTKTVT